MVAPVYALLVRLLAAFHANLGGVWGRLGKGEWQQRLIYVAHPGRISYMAAEAIRTPVCCRGVIALLVGLHGGVSQLTGTDLGAESGRGSFG